MARAAAGKAGTTGASAPPGTGAPPGASDVDRLHELGYAQELRRGLGTFSNFAISFSIISILAGGWTSYWLGLNAGGPIVVFVGWIVVGFFALLVGAAMGEICSTYPTAGGLYYWSAKLARRNGAMWSWMTGWFNLLGLIGVIASVDYALATFIGFFVQLYRPAFELSVGNVFLIYAGVLVAHGLLNTFGVRLVRVLGDVSVWWHVAGVVIIVAVLFVVPDNRSGLGIVFEFRNLTGWSFPGSGLYVFALGLLLAQYTITGFDASAHVSEETVDAHRNAPKAIVRAIYVSAIAAFVMNVAMTQAIPEGQYETIAAGFLTAAPQLMVAAVGGAGAKLLILISIVGQFFCGLASVTAASRMIYAFSRDGALPGSRTWHRINPKTRTPTNSVWLAAVAALTVGLLTFIQNESYSVAFFALTGICVVGLYISYVIPVYLRLRNPAFRQGEWNLGRWSRPIGWAAVIWVAFITVLFFSPLFSPWNTLNTFNFTGPLIVGSFLLFGLAYAFWAKNWFRGPKVQGSPEELAAIEAELAAVS